jgi:hypothetical protein
VLDSDAHQFRQRADAKLCLELGAGIGDRFVTHVEVLGDDPVGLPPSATSASVCSSRTVMRRKGFVVPLASMKATSEARSWLRYGLFSRTFQKVFSTSSEDVSFRT